MGRGREEVKSKGGKWRYGKGGNEGLGREGGREERNWKEMEGSEGGERNGGNKRLGREGGVV